MSVKGSRVDRLIHAHARQSFQVFSAERKRDRAKGFDVEQIIAQLLGHVQKYDDNGGTCTCVYVMYGV